MIWYAQLSCKHLKSSVSQIISNVLLIYVGAVNAIFYFNRNVNEHSYKSFFLVGLKWIFEYYGNVFYFQDFVEMSVHHIVTILLIGLSWNYNAVRVGTLVICIHDPVDYILAVSILQILHNQ